MVELTFVASVFVLSKSRVERFQTQIWVVLLRTSLSEFDLVNIGLGFLVLLELLKLVLCVELLVSPLRASLQGQFFLQGYLVLI